MIGYGRNNVHGVWVVIVVIPGFWVVVFQLWGVARIVEFFKLAVD